MYSINEHIVLVRAFWRVSQIALGEALLYNVQLSVTGICCTGIEIN